MLTSPKTRLCIGVCLSALCLPLAAQNLVTLAGVTGGDRAAGTVSPTTGVVTLGAGLSGASLPSPGGVNAIDPVGNRLFFLGGSPDKLYTVDLSTRTLLSSPDISGSMTGVIGLKYDVAEAKLYALVSISGDRQVATIDVATGAATLIGSPIAGASIGTPSSSDDLDATGNRYFFVGTLDFGTTFKIYTIRTTDGAVLANPDISGPAVNGLMGLRYDAAEDMLYVLVSVVPNNDRQLATVNRTTGVLTLLGAPVNGNTVGTNSAFVLDPGGNRYYFAGTPTGGSEKLYGINTATGLVATSPDLSGSYTFISGLEWDADSLPVELQRFSIE